MKLICNEKHHQKLETFFARYQELDIILVEQGIEYAGLYYTFTLNNLKSVESDLNEMLERYLIGYLAEKIYRINYQDIVYIEGFSKEVYLNTQTCQYLCHYKLYELEQLLDKYSFIRINRSIIVNINYIEYMLPELNSRYTLYMQNGIMLVLTRSYLKKFKGRLEIR